MAQQYSLKWNNHQPNFISMFAMLRNTQALVDVTLAAEGRHLHAHKMVLSACSPYFHSLFVENPSRHPIVILKDVAFSDLRTIVDFMYYGEVNVTQEELPQMLHSAKSLKVKGLTETESTSVMRSQSSEFPAEAAGEGGEVAGECGADGGPRRASVGSPAHSPSAKRRRRRRSSGGSAGGAGEEARAEPPPPPPPLEARDGLTVSSLPRRRDFAHDDSVTHQGAEQHALALEELGLEPGVTAPPGGQWSMMEHSYPRYSNSWQPDGGGAYVHLEGELQYAAGAGEAGGGGGGGGGGEACTLPAAFAPPAPPAPADPAPQKRRRTANPQSEENFQRALEAVRVGGIGFCKAARMFGVNNRTLWLEYKKKGYPNNRPSIKSRIKREHGTPPPPHKEDEQHLLLCPAPHAPHAPHALAVGYVEPLQGMGLLGSLNFNSMQ